MAVKSCGGLSLRAGLAALAATVALVPATALADTIGNAQDGVGCSTSDRVQLGSAAPTSYTVPAGNWVITEWSTQGSTQGMDGDLALEVWQPTAASDTLLLVGRTASQHVLAGSGPNSFPLAAGDQIAVQGGDLLGLQITSQAACANFTGNFADTFAIASSPASQGATSTFFPALHAFRLNVAATLAAAAPPPPPTPISADDCRDGGWQSFTDGTGTPFKNQGDCVSFVMTGGQNPAGG